LGITTARTTHETPANGGKKFAQRGAEPHTSASLAAFCLATLRDQDRFASEITEAILSDVPEMGRMPRQDLYDAVRHDFHRALVAISGRRLPDEGEVAASSCVVAELARMGVTMDTVLHARRVSIRRSRELLREAGVRRGLDASAQIELVHRIWEWADAIQQRDANAHRNAVLEMNGDGDEDRSWFVRAVLQGTLPPSDVARRAGACGLLAGTKYMAFRARPADGTDLRLLERAIATAGKDGNFEALVTTLDGELGGIVRRAPDVSPPAVVGLGPETEFGGLSGSFELATRALETAAALGREGVVTMDELSLRPAVLAEEHLGSRLIARYLEPLSELGEFGATLEATVRVYLDHGMRIEESARALFVHPNTLRHRIDRFQQLTGANLRRTEDLLELWWALERRSLSS
jgi:putative transposase